MLKAVQFDYFIQQNCLIVWTRPHSLFNGFMNIYCKVRKPQVVKVVVNETVNKRHENFISKLKSASKWNRVWIFAGKENDHFKCMRSYQ